MKQRFLFFLILVALGIIALILVVGSMQTPSQKKVTTSNTITVTVLNNIGVREIDITNLNTGKTFQFTLISLPAQFNCTRGDFLEITVTTNTGYRWNAWWFSPQDFWNNDNPAIICADGKNVYNNEMIMLPNCIIVLAATPKPSNTPIE